jgi:4-amino-4-deoxy-L-arabinose transferase-like glycosyltransferase
MRWLLVILVVSLAVRLAAAFYLGDQVEPTPGAYDQIYHHDVALNLLAGKGFVFTRPPWPFIEPGVPTSYTSFLYQLFLAAIYLIFGPHPLAARIVQALVCSLMPWLVYRLILRVLQESPTWGELAGTIGLASAGITAGYAYFVYYSAVLMTEGLYLVLVVWALTTTLELADRPTVRRWAVWGLAVGLAILIRQVFLPMAGLLFVYVAWRTRGRVRWLGVLAAAGVTAALILPWTIRNYLIFDRFLLLNSQAGQVFWNANHPDLGVTFDDDTMLPIPEDLEGANEVDLSNELMRRGLEAVASDPWRFVRLCMSKAVVYFKFWPSANSSMLSNVARTSSFGVCLPFMLAGLAVSAREWRRWMLLYLFAVAYATVHIITWTQIRYRMPVDAVLVPFAALACVSLVARWRREDRGGHAAAR